jgi:hypothetical protein
VHRRAQEGDSAQGVFYQQPILQVGSFGTYID